MRTAPRRKATASYPNVAHRDEVGSRLDTFRDGARAVAVGEVEGRRHTARFSWSSAHPAVNFRSTLRKLSRPTRESHSALRSSIEIAVFVEPQLPGDVFRQLHIANAAVDLDDHPFEPG
jgi:hypothetical protein